MKNIIICEGSTDYILLQYYMREALNWKDDVNIQKNIIKMPGQKSRNLKKESNILTIMAAGGCSKLIEGLKVVLDRNYLANPDLVDVYSKIVIITDRDGNDTESEFIKDIADTLDTYVLNSGKFVVNNKWTSYEMETQVGQMMKFQLLLLVIPFEQNGAMETFLLNAISDEDSYDKKIIQSCNQFVDKIDYDKKYLVSRRYVTKAKFDTYFSIRTPAEQFVERQDIMKSVKWENYSKIQNDFIRLSEI